MKQNKPRVKPSQRQKKRYILFHYASGKASFQEMQQLVKRLASGLFLVEFHSASGMGIVRCERGTEPALRQALNGIGLRTMKTSGTLKKLRTRP